MAELHAGLYLDHIRRDGANLAKAAQDNLDARVPGCPDWDVAQLLGHTGHVHRRVTETIRRRAAAPPDLSTVGAAPDDRTVLAEWFEEGVGCLIDALSAAGPDAAVWNWSANAPAPAMFWWRRMAQETVVHRADAEQASGVSPVVDARLGADGVDEMCDIFLPRAHDFVPGADLGGTIHLHATDTPGEWLITLTADTIEVSREHGRADVAARGPSGQLLLLLWGRVPPGALETHGDVAILDRWQTTIRI